MSIIGFNFTKISVEKKKPKAGGKVEISNNVMIKNVEESDLKLSSKEQIAVRYEFEFETKYQPEYGHINLSGNLISLEKKDAARKAIKEWSKTKKMNPEMMKSILNTLLAKCHVQALVLSRDVNLPSPVPLPKVNVKEDKK
ncbi:hypothetical protein GOV05_04965 [Candidatus Woesearchaeota archaeon]|nr:hypothetical protein [Candidatus Woesearchaeota archaeon]